MTKLYIAQKPAQDSEQFEMNLATLQPEIQTYLMEYALDVIRQRTYAKEDATKEDVRKRFQALVDGELPSRGGPRLDPVEKEFKDLVIKAAVHHKVVQKAPAVSKADIPGLIAKLVKKTGNQKAEETLRANAAEIVADRKAKEAAAISL